MSCHDPMPYSRRLFLQQGLTLASLLPTVPAFIQQSALGMMLPQGSGVSSQAGVPEDRILVLVQLAGGNDGLNTVVPYGDRNYYNARPQLGIREPGADGNAALRTAVDGLGLHPNLTSFKELMDEGVASIIQGVGYPNPNRSHFASTDIWETADTSGKGSGWVGRYFDCTCNGTPDPQGAVAIGREAPLAMQGQVSKPIGFESADLFQWLGKGVDKDLSPVYDEINRRGVTQGVDPHTSAGFLMRTAMDAQVSSEQIRKAVSARPLSQYPANDLARQLAMVSSMIRAGLKTRVYYVTLGGFDTHAGQGGENGRHAQLMQQVGSSLKAFYDDLKKQENDQRVLTVTFSEFGRRVAQNASGGTDHGAAAPMFLFGPMVRSGVLGDHPSLTDLDQGDVKYKVDFRSVYSGVLEQWLKADSKKILEASYQPVKVLKTA